VSKRRRRDWVQLSFDDLDLDARYLDVIAPELAPKPAKVKTRGRVGSGKGTEHAGLQAAAPGRARP
jgi:hypothetical protein